MKFISKILEICLWDLHHFPVPIFTQIDNSKFQNVIAHLSDLPLSKFHIFQFSIFKSPNYKFPDFKHILRDENVSRMFPYFLLFLKYFCDKYGVPGSRFNRLFGSSNNHPKSIAIHPGIEINNFGIIKTHEN